MNQSLIQWLSNMYLHVLSLVIELYLYLNKIHGIIYNYTTSHSVQVTVVSSWIVLSLCSFLSCRSCWSKWKVFVFMLIRRTSLELYILFYITPIFTLRIRNPKKILLSVLSCFTFAVLQAYFNNFLMNKWSAKCFLRLSHGRKNFAFSLFKFRQHMHFR